MLRRPRLDTALPGARDERVGQRMIGPRLHGGDEREQFRVARYHEQSLPGVESDGLAQGLVLEVTLNFQLWLGGRSCPLRSQVG